MSLPEGTDPPRESWDIHKGRGDISINGAGKEKKKNHGIMNKGAMHEAKFRPDRAGNHSGRVAETPI